MTGHKSFRDLLTPEQLKKFLDYRGPIEAGGSDPWPPPKHVIEELMRTAQARHKEQARRIMEARKEAMDSMIETNPEAYAPMPHGKASVSKSEKFGWTIQGEPGEFLPIHKQHLQVDRRYQRALNEPRAVAIASRFNWIRFGVLSVARREDGSLWVFDGQTRLHAVKKLKDIQMVPCVIFDLGNDIQKEAAAFLEINKGSKSVAGLDNYRALLVAEDRTAILLDEMFKATGYEPSTKSTGRSVKCIHALLKIAKDPERIKRLWPLLVLIHDGMSIHQRIVEAIDYLAKATDDRIHEARYRTRLIDAGKQGLVSAITKAAAYHSAGGAKVWAQGIVEHVINKGLHEQNKIFI